MNTRIRIAFSTLLGLSLVGLCLGSAQAQTGTNKTKAERREMRREMRHDQMDEMDGSWMDDDVRPAPINYPFSAPGGLHLFHYTDYSREGVGEGSSYEKRMENRWRRDKEMHDRLMREEAMMTDEEKKLMRVPAPINYPFSSPGGLHLFHWTDYSMEELAPESSYMKTMDNRYEQDKMLHERLTRAESTMSDEEKELMTVPAPINYPFAAPGGVHLYHYTDYSREELREGSAAMERMDRMEKREKQEKERRRERMSK